MTMAGKKRNKNNHTRMRLLSCTLALIAIFLVPLATATAKPSLQTSQACTRYLADMEQFFGIPAHWLSAIASTESGRYHAGIGLSVPWPWAINVEGKGYWFDTKAEAIKTVRRYQRKGVTSIDIGCMQVNLHYHGHHFANLEQMFDPLFNVAYAAKFLRQNYDQSKSWRDATATYHSKTPHLGSRYYRKVYERWQDVLNKLDEAAYSLAMAEASLPPFEEARRKVEVVHPTAYRNESASGKHNSIREISVQDGQNGSSRNRSSLQHSRRKGVLVIRVKNPSAASQPVQITASKADGDTVESTRAAEQGSQASQGGSQKGQFAPRIHAHQQESKKANKTELANNASPFIF